MLQEKMKHFTLSIVTFALCSLALLVPRGGAAQTPDSLTLADVVQRAVQNHPAVLRAEEEARAADARIGQSRSALYPTVGGQADYTRIGPTPTIPFGASEFELAPANNFDLHVGGSYSVYDFGRNAAQIELAQTKATQAADAVNNARTTLAYQASRAFYGILYLEQSIEVQDQQIAALDEHRSMAQKRVETGAGIHLDVLTTDVRVAAAQSQRVDLVSALERQKTALAPDAPVNVRGELELTPVSQSEDSLTTLALRGRTEMRLAQDAEASAKVQRRLADLAELPTFNAIASAGFKNGYPPELNDWVANYAAGARISVPIFSGKRKEFQQQEAEAALRSQQAATSALERQIRGEIGRALTDVRAAQEKYRISQVAIERANAAVAVARSAYSYGTLTNVDLLDAETSVAVAKLAQVQALFNYEDWTCKGPAKFAGPCCVCDDPDVSGAASSSA
jgi:outer membrane protein